MYHLYATISFYILLAMIALSRSVFAAPLLITDDAGIVDPNNCQIELDQSFYKHDMQAVHVTPSCQFIPGVELSVPLAFEDDLQSYALAAKIPFLETDRVAIAASVAWKPKQTEQERQWTYNIPLSWYASKNWQFDVNVGQERFPSEHENTWAVAGHYTVSDLHQVSVEFFKNEAHHRQSQVVYQYQAVPEKVAIFASVGGPIQNKRDASWFGLGLSYSAGR